MKNDEQIFRSQKFVWLGLAPALLSFYLLTSCFQVNAQTQQAGNRPFNIEDWQAPVAQNARTTFFVLLQKVFPGIDGEASESLVAKGAFSFHNLGHPKEVIEREGAIEVSYGRALWFEDEGAERLALLVNGLHTDREGGVEEFNVLAAFSIRPKLQLIDAAEVDFDRWVDFWEEAPLLTVRRGETAFWLRATHHNSSEGFHFYALTELRDNRLRIILDEPFGLINVKLCGSETVQTLRMEHERGVAAGYYIFDFSVRSETLPTGDCGPQRPVKAGFKNQLYRLSWNARQKRYRATLLKTTSGKLSRKTKRE